MDRRRRRCALLCRAVLVVPLALLATGLASVGAGATGGPLSLSVTPDQTVYVSGDQVTLTLQVTNAGGTPCEVADLTDGVVVVDGFTRDGVPVTPASTILRYDDSLGSIIAGALTTLDPGQSLLVPWASAINDLTGNQALTSVTFAGDDNPPADLLDVATPGAYEVQVHYEVPAISGAPADVCTIGSNVASATFTVVAAPPPPAGPVDGIVVDPLANDAFKKAVADCFAKFDAAGGDPMGIMPALRNSTKTTTIRSSAGGNSESATVPNDGKSARDGGTGKGSDANVNWNPNNTTKYAEGIARDPCASLYHELFHAYEDVMGISDDRIFGTTGIPTTEVNATRAENAYRKAQGLPLRTKYGDRALPAAAGTKVPTCVLSATIAGPPKQIQITVQDNDTDGLDNVVPVGTTNATVTFPAITRGTKNAVVVTATKTNQANPATVSLYVTDVDGNLTKCDPVVTTVTVGSRLLSSTTFTALPRSEHLLHVANASGSRGLAALVVRVDGRPFAVALRPGQSRVVDVGPAMTRPTGNTIVFTPVGRPGGSADVVIADS